MSGRTRSASALALVALAACSTLQVEFAEPAGARTVVGGKEPVTLPATLAVLSPLQLRVELDFDVPTLVGYGLSTERAEALVAAGKAKIVGRMALRGDTGASEEESVEPLRFALPGAAVVRALESGERVRCWWPPEGRRRLWFEGSVQDDGAWRVLDFGERNVTAHTQTQKSAELGAISGGAVVAVMLLLVLVFASV